MQHRTIRFIQKHRNATKISWRNKILSLKKKMK